MSVMFIFVPMIFSVLLVGAMGKLAVYLSRSGTLSWKHSFFFGGFLFTLTMAVKVFLNFFPLPDMPGLLRVAFGLALTTTFAAFFFGHHAVTVDRVAIGRAGAVKAAAVWAGLFALLLLPILLLVPRP